MVSIEYKGTFAAKGSELYKAITEKRPDDAKRIYAETTSRMYALLNKLAVPRAIFELDKEGKATGKWHIESADASYDNNGRFKEKK
jgi:hypothetical protein